MKVNGQIERYRSFEQLKSAMFPKLAEEERKKLSDSGSAQLGSCMADEAINGLLNERRKANTRSHASG